MSRWFGVRPEDARTAGDVEPILFEFGKGEFRGAPAGDEGPMPSRSKTLLMFADDLTEPSAYGVACDSAADFFPGDEAKTEMRESLHGSGGKHQ